MKKILKTTLFCVLAGLVFFGFAACGIPRVQSAVGVATAMQRRNGGSDRGWSVIERNIDTEVTSGTLGGNEARRFELVAKAMLIREYTELAVHLDRTIVMAYVWEFASEADARGFVGALNANDLLASETNVYSGKFALSGVRYPSGPRNEDGTFNIYVIREASNDIDNLVTFFRWAVR